MNPSHRNGVVEISEAGPGSTNIGGKLLSFLADTAHTFDLEGAFPEDSYYQIHALSRSVDGFIFIRNFSHRTTSAAAEGYQFQRRSRQIARDGIDHYALCLSFGGPFEISQCGRHETIESGSYTFFSASEPATFGNGAAGTFDTMMFFLPRTFVDRRIVSGEDACARHYAPGVGINSLVIETITAFSKNAWTITDNEFYNSARIIADLVLFSANNSADLTSGNRSVRAGNLARAKHIIRKRYADSNLSVVDVARETGVSVNYLYELFRGEDGTMCEYLKRVRLQEAHKKLAQASQRDMTVTDVALACGFSSVSHFSRSFKQAFGLSPRDVLLRKLDI